MSADLTFMSTSELAQKLLADDEWPAAARFLVDHAQYLPADKVAFARAMLRRDTATLDQVWGLVTYAEMVCAVMTDRKRN